MVDSSNFPSTEMFIRPSVHQKSKETAEVDGWTANTANLGGYKEKKEIEYEEGEI